MSVTARWVAGSRKKLVLRIVQRHLRHRPWGRSPPGHSRRHRSGRSRPCPGRCAHRRQGLLEDIAVIAAARQGIAGGEGAVQRPATGRCHSRGAGGASAWPTPLTLRRCAARLIGSNTAPAGRRPPAAARHRRPGQGGRVPASGPRPGRASRQRRPASQQPPARPYAYGLAIRQPAPKSF